MHALIHCCHLFYIFFVTQILYVSDLKINLQEEVCKLLVKKKKNGGAGGEHCHFAGIQTWDSFNDVEIAKH